MGSAAFKRKLIHKATFLEPTESRTDSGQVTFTWDPIDNGVGGTMVGRYVHRTHEMAAPWLSFQMTNQHLWLCDSAETVEEEYRVRNIVSEDGCELSEAAGTWSVESVIARRTYKLHHYELKLKKVE